jgi:hypothetical protein
MAEAFDTDTDVVAAWPDSPLILWFTYSDGERPFVCPAGTADRDDRDSETRRVFGACDESGSRLSETTLGPNSSFFALFADDLRLETYSEGVLAADALEETSGLLLADVLRRRAADGGW